MAAPNGKTFIKLADGRTISVASEDAAKYEYFSEGGKVMRRPKEPAAAAPPPAPRPAPAAPPAPRPAPAPVPAPRPAAPVQQAPPPPAPRPPAPRAPPPPPPAPRAPPPAPRPAAPRAATRRMPARGPALNYNMRAIIVAAILVLLVLANATLISGYGNFLSQLSPCTVNQRSFPQTAEFNVTRNFGIASPGGQVTYHLSLAQPYDIPGQQDLISAPIMTPLPTDTNGKLWWNRTIPQGAHESISVTYPLRMTTVIWNLKDADVGSVADVPANYRAVYLDEEWKINPNSPTVQRLAEQVTDPTDTVLQQLKDIYKYLLCPPYSYLAGGSFEPQSPEQLVQSQAGDCDDFSVLFISMARYLGIPAWLELGLLYDELRGEWGPHGWATVYIPLKAGGGVIATVDVVNKLFLIRDPYHFSDWSADGDADHLRSYYTLLTYAPATTPPLTLSSTIPPVQFHTSGVVNYFSP